MRQTDREIMRIEKKHDRKKSKKTHAVQWWNGNGDGQTKRGSPLGSGRINDSPPRL